MNEVKLTGMGSQSSRVAARTYVLVEALVLHPVMLTVILQPRALRGEMGTPHMIHQWLSVTILVSQYLFLAISFAGLKRNMERLERFCLAYYQLVSTIGGCMSMVIRGSSPPCPAEGIGHFRDINFCMSFPGHIEQDTLSAVSLIQVLHVEFLQQDQFISYARLAVGLVSLVFSVFNVFVFELRFTLSYVINFLIYCCVIAWVHYRESRKMSQKEGYAAAGRWFSGGDRRGLHALTSGVPDRTLEPTTERPRIHFRDIVASMEYSLNWGGAEGAWFPLREVSCGDLNAKDSDTASILSDVTFDYGEPLVSEIPASC